MNSVFLFSQLRERERVYLEFFFIKFRNFRLFLQIGLASSSDLASAYTDTPVDYAEVQCQAIHFRGIESLRRNKVLITNEPDMGVGLGVMDYDEYVYKTLVMRTHS